MVHAHCMQDNQVYKHTIRIRNIYCFSSATMVARSRWILGLYVHYLLNSKFLVAEPLKFSLPFRDRKVNHSIHKMPPTNSVLSQTNSTNILSTLAEEHEKVCGVRGDSINNFSVIFVGTFSIHSSSGTIL